MSQEPVSTRVPSDDKRRLEQYCSNRDVSKSEALRRSIRKLTDDSNHSKQDNQRTDDPIWRATILAGLFYAGLSSAGLIPDLIIPVLGAVILIIGGYSLIR